MSIRFTDTCALKAWQQPVGRTAAENDWYRAHLDSDRLVMGLDEGLVVTEYTAIAVEMLDILLVEIETEGLSMGAYGVV